MDANGRTPGSFDINAASVDALDHIDGGGRIGRAIASHRPYHSVDDLVRKRVLRKDVFERIKGQLAAN
ncbi:helix-hairpin-helix domain-containing protein [Lichenifustis flavocetrariae]|uniref:helix-hairpin-helix domain-containing protein n=1 Tax=Lichenifustis flavocetrariae TaxID=2949735 RepID=UPI003D0A02B0